MRQRRNITVDVRMFLVPGTFVWIKFIEEGWVPAIVEENSPAMLFTKSIIKPLPVNVRNWYSAYQQGNIIISPN